jgi:hypothetical protein
MSRDHRSIREGAQLGVLVATAIWIWLASIDALVGQPFHTFTVLGGVLSFTALHYLLNVVCGNLIGAALGWSILIRSHPLREELREADGEENE